MDYGKVLWPHLAHPGVRALAITLLVLGYTWINIRGIRQTAAVNTTFTVLKIVPLVAFVAIGLFFVDSQALTLDSLPAAQDLSTAILLAATSLGHAAIDTSATFEVFPSDVNLTYSRDKQTLVVRITDRGLGGPVGERR